MNEQLSASEIVKRARSDNKITGMEIIQNVFPDFVELHGDRAGGDDPAIVGGIATFHQQTVTVITTDRGKTTDEKIIKHFGSPMPSGYRKALRLIKQAAKLSGLYSVLLIPQEHFLARKPKKMGKEVRLPKIFYK